VLELGGLGVLFMAVRVKLRIMRGDSVIETIALINSGYEADSPQLMIPLTLAKTLGTWPPPPDSREAVFETAGGPVKVWVIKRGARVRVIASDVESREVEVDLVISPLIDEPLISDILAGRLEIAVEDFAEGLWRFKWESIEKLRKSEKRVF
jgi:hypothetical protein